MTEPAQVLPKAKKSVALSGTAAGNTALCTVGRSGNDLHYRGYDIHDLATKSSFEEVAHLLVHGALPNAAQLRAYRAKLKRLRGHLACIAHQLYFSLRLKRNHSIFESTSMISLVVSSMLSETTL